MCGGERVFHDIVGRGVACIGGEDLSNIWCWCRLEWPKSLTQQMDEKRKHFGCKSTTLEAIGILLPFLAFPEKIIGKNVVFEIDNMVVLFRWYNGNDKTASAVLNSVHYLSSVTGTKVNVEQVNRVLNDIVDLTDELSRKRYSSNEEAVCALEKAEKRNSQWQKCCLQNRQHGGALRLVQRIREKQQISVRSAEKRTLS